MKSYLGLSDSENQKGKFTPILLENGSFPITQECMVNFNGQDFHIAEYFRNVPEKFRPVGDNKEVITEHVYRLISHVDNDKTLITIRLIHSPWKNKYLYLNLLSPESEMNFGYLLFSAIRKHLLIREYDPQEPRSHSDSSTVRGYGKDSNLTSLTLDTLAEIGKNVYRSERLRNIFSGKLYGSERERFLDNGFEEVEEAGGKVWIREI